MLINGSWDRDTDRTIENERFVREQSGFGDPIPSAVIQQMGKQSNRFILVVSMSCPWSHRTLLVRSVKKLQQKLPLVHTREPRVEGYGLDPDETNSVLGLPDIQHLHQLYTLTKPNFTGRVTVPLLWDGHENHIISNDSQNIMRALDAVDSETEFTLVPAHLAREIHELNTTIHESLANAVYRAGLAENQNAYDEAVHDVFNTLDSLESRLGMRRYLFGSAPAETDLRLFAILVRFDTVYATHFRCTRQQLVDYPNLWAYTRDLYTSFDFAETVDFEVNQRGYYLNDGDNNPHGIIPELPRIDWHAPHGREALG